MRQLVLSMYLFDSLMYVDNLYLGLLVSLLVPFHFAYWKFPQYLQYSFSLAEYYLTHNLIHLQFVYYPLFFYRFRYSYRGWMTFRKASVRLSYLQYLFHI